MDYLYLGFFILVLVSFFTGILISAIGYSMVVIDNPDPNSMWPTYFQGDLFVLEDVNPEDIVLGDVVVYEKSSGDKIIHRVIDVVIINNQYFFRVKGDNPISNSSPDPGSNLTTLISADSILGKIVYRIPYLGHLSLAMQRNAAIQIFVYFLAILLGIAIVFWPDDEEVKEDEFIDINLSSIKVFFIAIIAFPIFIILKIKNSDHRILYSFGSILLIFLLILPAFIPSFISISSTRNGIGVHEINSSQTTQYSETLNDQSLDFSFTQVEITLFDNEGFWSRIKGFTLTAYTIENDPNSLISITKWKSMRDFKGTVTIGASLVIDKDDQPSNSSSIYLVVTLNWVEFFTEKSEEYYADIIYQSA